MEMYEPKILGSNTTVSVNNIALQIASKNVVIVAGAGVSKAPPTGLPTGQDIARTLKHRLSYTALADCVKDLPEDLLAIADAAESHSLEALELVQKTILDSFDFKTAYPNYAHQFLALLMAEGTVQAMTTNWDTCIERAAAIMSSDLVACRQPAELAGAGSSAVLLKLHGCAEIEDSIRVSSSQVGKPAWWVGHQMSAAIARNMVVFVGAGSIFPYVRETIIGILEIGGEDSRIRVVDIQLNQDWNDLLHNPSGEFFIRDSAEEFLDGIIRSLTMSKLSQAVSLANQLTGSRSIEGVDIRNAIQQVIEFFQQYPAHSLWLWVRRCIFPSVCGPAVLSPTFVRYMLAITLIHSILPLQEMETISNIVSVGCKDFIIELAWAKEAVTSDILCQKKTESVIANKRNHTLPAATPCIIIVDGVVGPLPAPTTPESVVDTPGVADIIDGPQTLAANWISLDSLLTVPSIEKLHDLVGV